jgi:hypothetical protein
MSIETMSSPYGHERRHFDRPFEPKEGKRRGYNRARQYVTAEELSQALGTVMDENRTQGDKIQHTKAVGRMEIKSLQEYTTNKNLSYKIKDVINKVTDFGYAGVDALLLHPFSPHPLGQENTIDDDQLTQSDEQTKLINHALAFQYQDGLKKAASFHFADSEAFQKARDLVLSSIAKIDNVQPKAKYFLETLGSETLLAAANNRITRIEKHLGIIDKWKGLDSRSVLKLAKCAIEEVNPGIQNEYSNIRQSKQLVEKLIKQLGAPESLKALKENLETYEDALEKAATLGNKLSESIESAGHLEKSHETASLLKRLEQDTKNLIAAEDVAREALVKLNKNYTNEQKSYIKQALKHNISSHLKETQEKLAESIKQIEKIEQGYKEAVQKEEKAATVAHLILDRVEGGRVNINGILAHISEIGGLDTSKEGQTKVIWRPDIPDIIMTIRDPETEKNKSEKLVNEKFLQDFDAKRLAKVEKETGWGKCIFEIPGNTFDTFDSSDGGKHVSRSNAILILECHRDPDGKKLNQDYQELIDIEKIPIKLPIDTEGCKIVKNRKGEDIRVGVAKKTYTFKSADGKDVTVTIKEETNLLKRPRNGDIEEIMTKTTTQTQTCTYIKDGESKEYISTRKTDFTQTVDKNNIISKEERKIYTEYENSNGQAIRSKYEIPAVTLQKIAIDAATKNVKMLAERMVMISTKTLPDSPIIYHSEVKPNPEIDLRQMDRINLIDKKLYTRNGRTLDLSEIDWLKTWGKGNAKANSDVVFRTVGPKKTYLVSLTHAGSDRLFTQENKAKENKLIATIEENQIALLRHLKQSIQQVSESIASGTFDTEILQKAVMTAEMYDHELKRHIAASMEMVMEPPEDRNTLAQLMRDREASQSDAVMPKKAVDGNSEQTYRMTEAAKNFRNALINAMTDKSQEAELLTQIVADQQGQGKLVAYDNYYHQLSLVDHKILDLLDIGKKRFNITNMANAAEIRKNVSEKTNTLNVNIKKNSEDIEKNKKFIDDVYIHADQIKETIHLISNIKKLEDEIDNSSDLYAKNWLNLKRAKAAADHNTFKGIEAGKVSTTISKEAARHHKNWLIIRNAIEDKGIKGAYVYIDDLKVPILSNTNSAKEARKAFEQLYINYLTQVKGQAKGDYASIKVALCKAECLRQYIDKHEKNAQDMISQGVPLAERQNMLNALPDIDESFLLTPARPKFSEGSLTSVQSQQNANEMFDSGMLRNKSSEQLSYEARDRAILDLKEATEAVEKLINFEVHDPILKNQLRKDAKDLIKVITESTRDYKKLGIKIQQWWRKLPEMRKLQWMQFWMTLWAPVLNPQSTINTVGDGLNRMNSKFVNSIVGSA